VSAEGEVVDGSTLSAQVEDPDLGIRDTSVVSRLGIRLVLAVAVATSWTTSHLGLIRLVEEMSLWDAEGAEGENAPMFLCAEWVGR